MHSVLLAIGRTGTPCCTLFTAYCPPSGLVCCSVIVMVMCILGIGMVQVFLWLKFYLQLCVAAFLPVAFQVGCRYFIWPSAGVYWYMYV